MLMLLRSRQQLGEAILRLLRSC
ncbi:unnamed protein product [Fusarium graminearum]|nr:unnamed protein product [Fusarium graminearum]